MEDLGTRFNFRTSPEILEKIEDLYKKSGCATKGEFIEKAIIFYCGYLTANDYREYFPNVIVSTMKATLDSMENRTQAVSLRVRRQVFAPAECGASERLASGREHPHRDRQGARKGDVQRASGASAQKHHS